MAQAPAGRRTWFRQGWEEWLDEADASEGTPFLLSPGFDYDVELNGYFHRAAMVGAPWNTQAAYARDIAGFFSFPVGRSGGRGWRDAVEADHLAYLRWRRGGEAGSRVSASTWSREVTAVNQFYSWAVDRGLVAGNPVPQRSGRTPPRGLSAAAAAAETVPATLPHDVRRERIEWLPPAAYRRWRDVGLRGYGPDGLPDPAFCGRWAARNAVFADLMVRTGLRLAEQASLTGFELPTGCGGGGYQRLMSADSSNTWDAGALDVAGRARGSVALTRTMRAPPTALIEVFRERVAVIL